MHASLLGWCKYNFFKTPGYVFQHRPLVHGCIRCADDKSLIDLQRKPRSCGVACKVFIAANQVLWLKWLILEPVSTHHILFVQSPLYRALRLGFGSTLDSFTAYCTMLRPPRRSGISSFCSHLCASNFEADLFKTLPTLQALQNASAPCRKHKVELQVLSEQCFCSPLWTFPPSYLLCKWGIICLQLKGIQLQLQLLIASMCACRK